LHHLDVSRNDIQVPGLLALGDKFVLRRDGKLIFNCAGNVMKTEERGTVSLHLNLTCPQKELIMEDSDVFTESHGRLLVELVPASHLVSLALGLALGHRPIQFGFLCVKTHCLEVPSDSEQARFADAVFANVEAAAAAPAPDDLLEADLHRASDGLMRLCLKCSKVDIDNVNEDDIRDMVQDRLQGWQVLLFIIASPRMALLSET
jgi:hypothetical protein